MVLVIDMEMEMEMDISRGRSGSCELEMRSRSLVGIYLCNEYNILRLGLAKCLSRSSRTRFALTFLKTEKKSKFLMLKIPQLRP
jgi:hypothetical protein